MLLSRFWEYCKLYHNLVTFHCLTQTRLRLVWGQTVKGHQLWYNLQYTQNLDNNHGLSITYTIAGPWDNFQI